VSDEKFTCTHCGQTTRYPNHVASRYCSTCQHYCDQPDESRYVCELEAERDRLRGSVKVQTDASDAAAEAVGAMAEKTSATLAENTRLQRVLADVFTALYPPVPVDPASVSSSDVVEYTDLPAHIATMRAERDRLRAVVAGCPRCEIHAELLDVSPTMGEDA
jgi:hypothetical protein